MKYFILAVIATILLLLEASVTTIPLVLGFAIMLSSWSRTYWLIGVTFLLGFFLDLVAFQPLGISSLFFLVVLTLIFLYKRKYEIQSPIFITISAFIASLIYGGIFAHHHVFFSACIVAAIMGLVYTGYSLLFLPHFKEITLHT